MFGALVGDDEVENVCLPAVSDFHKFAPILIFGGHAIVAGFTYYRNGDLKNKLTCAGSYWDGHCLLDRDRRKFLYFVRSMLRFFCFVTFCVNSFCIF